MTALTLGSLLLTGCGDSSAGSGDGVDGTAAGDASDTDSDEMGEGGDDGDPCGGCDDDDPCTEDICEASGACTYEPIVDNACRPVITVDYPPRAATLLAEDASTITVTGTVKSGLGDIVAFTVNDTMIFAMLLLSSPSLLTLSKIIEDPVMYLSTPSLGTYFRKSNATR